jgi:voltage-gated sodium channel
MNPALPPQAAAAPTLQQRVRNFVEHGTVQRTVMWLIVLNAVILGLETSASLMAVAGPQLRALDQALLAVFVVEIALRLYAHRSAFFRDPWSVFDLAVVGIALLPATGPLAVLRALRVLRVLRLLTIVPSMRRVVGALLSAIPGLASIAGVLSILFYVFGVIATKLFGDTFPEWFGSLGASLYTLFQVMTLESWSMGIARPVMEAHPQAWLFFVPFILIATFTMLNLFIAIIVSAMQSFNEEEAARTRETVDASREHIETDLHAEMQRLREQIAELRTVLAAPQAAAQSPTLPAAPPAAPPEPPPVAPATPR